jgi:hypothetical protein
VASDAGKYRVIVSNTGRKVTSQFATLTITATNCSRSYMSTTVVRVFVC